MIDRTEVRPDEFVDVMRMLIGDRGASVLLAAGEDRPQADSMYVHYLLGLKGSPWELRHISVALSRTEPALPSLAALSFPVSRFEREMRDLGRPRRPGAIDAIGLAAVGREPHLTLAAGRARIVGRGSAPRRRQPNNGQYRPECQPHRQLLLPRFCRYTATRMITPFQPWPT